MDKRTIKSVIIELKEENKSFQEISDILAREYEVKMSRQAVCGMYKRATSDETVQNNMNIILATTDIVNYHVIGLDTARIKELMICRGLNISIAKINEIISESADYKKALYKDLMRIISSKIRNGEDIENIKLALSYKGEKPSNAVINQLLSDYATLEIKESATKILAGLYNITEDKSLIKQISNKFNINISSRDLGKALNI